MTLIATTRPRDRWLVAGAFGLLVLFTAVHVYSNGCDTTNNEVLELEIQSVERGGNKVDDLSRWKRYDGEEILTIVRSFGDGVQFRTSTTSETSSITFDPSTSSTGE